MTKRVGAPLDQTTDAGPEGLAWRQQFVSDVFHALAQPLTALHCSLEIALMKSSDDAEHYRLAMEDALEMTKRLVDTTSFLREMAEAEDHGTPVIVSLSALLGRVLEDLRPVLESSGNQLAVDIQAGQWILADESKLEKALFLILDQIRSRLAEGGLLRIESFSGEEQAVVVNVLVPGDHLLPEVGECRPMKLAMKALEAIGANLTIRSDQLRSDGLVITFPAAIE